MNNALRTNKRANVYSPRPIQIVAGVERIANPCAGFDTYRGTADALIASGICTPDMVPPVGCVRVWRPDVPGTEPYPHRWPRYLRLRWSARGLLVAEVTADEQEQERREQERQRVDAARREEFDRRIEERDARQAGRALVARPQTLAHLRLVCVNGKRVGV